MKRNRPCTFVKPTENGHFSSVNVKLNKNPQPGRVYSIYRIAPTLSTMQGGHKVPYIVLKQNKKGS